MPTPLAATRLLPPDSLMAALDPIQFQGRVATSPFVAKYGTTIDRQSAYEIITSRLAAARQAAQAAADQAAQSAGVPATTAGQGGLMTPAQQRRAIEQQARDIARAQREAERQRRADQRAAAAEARARDRMVSTGVRTAGRVLTSRAGQSLIRGVFGTLFGGGR
ncbi:MAG: DUF853 family protein [Chloroflexi bacterium]|nr:DUF853 family protein [Chloroflexota bacterium]